MGAQSATGTGLGSSKKVTTKELAILANAPSILVADAVDLSDGVSSPPTPSARIVLTNPLPGSHVNYVVMITSLNAGTVYVSDMSDNDNDNFSEFSVIGEAEGSCMYFISKVGIRPII